MCRENKKKNFSAASFRFVFITGFFFVTFFVSSVRAQQAPLEQSSEISVLVTNILQLSQLLDTSPRWIADIDLNVLVCSTSRAEIGAVAVTDKTGSELLELGPRNTAISPGDIIHIEGRHCLLRRREVGIEITRAPDLDNDNVHGLSQVNAEVNLTAGLHPFQLDYFNLFGAYGLNLTCRLPDGSMQPAERYLYRPGSVTASESNGMAGLTATYYEGNWLNVPDFALLQPGRTAVTTNLDLMIGPHTELFGIRFKGFFSAPMSGKYTFNLESDDGSLLYLDTPEVPLTTIGHENVPSPVVSSLHTLMNESEASQWLSVEGRVAFVSRIGRGLRLELRSQPDSLWVKVADDKDLDPQRFLNSQIRVTGIGRPLITPNRERVLGELSVASSDNITILDDMAGIGVSGSTPTLTTVAQIQNLSKEEAARHLPVRIQGVVTSQSPDIFNFMSIQDETRGIFVNLSSAIEPTVLIGQFCEVIGSTDTGDFAPIVVARVVNVLGRGQMPPPARPTWNELINGSMDSQWVELQGLVTSVQNNTLGLFLTGGEVQIQAEGCSESQLKAYLKAVVRIRGVLFAVWNTNRTVQVGHLFMRNAVIGMDAPPPRNPFDAPLKSWSELYEFDPHATPFQRVKVHGTVIYADAKRVFVMENTRGICVLPVEPTNVEFGEEVEVVGYPDITGPAPILRESILRKTGSATEPKPRILNGNELMQGGFDSTLVRISATLLGIHSEQDSRVLEMNAQGHLFLAYLPDTAEPVSLRIGSQLALTGVWVERTTNRTEDNKPGEFDLLLSSPSQLTVLSQPSWWTPRRLLAMMGLLLVVLTLAALWISELRRLVEQRTRQLHREIRERESAERERALEAERSRIAHDLHDDLGSSLTEIGVLASKGQRADTMDELTALFRAITVKARGLVTALDIIVWTIDPKDNSLESVADYLSDFASEYLSHSGITCRFDIPIVLPSIAVDGRLRYDLLLAVKETLNNIVRHAQASEVEFRMAFEEDHLQIIISDNGKGFATHRPHAGNGLKNLPLRLSKLGGQYGIESSIGIGTTVTIRLRLSQRTESTPVSG